MRTRLAALLVLPALSGLCALGCLSHIGYEGVDPLSLKTTSNSAVDADEVRAIANGHDLFITMNRRMCKRVKRAVDLRVATPDLLRSVMCRKNRSRTYGKSSVFIALHFDFDDAKPNHLYAAVALVMCTMEKNCNRPTSTGQMAWYAENIDREAVRRSLDLVDVSPELRLAFLRRADAASRLILMRLAALGAREHELYYALPKRIRSERAADRQEDAGLWRRFASLRVETDNAIRDQRYNAELVEKIAGLRADVVGACLERSRPLERCVQGPMARPLTEDLVKLAIGLKDPLLARSENAVLVEGRDLRRVAAVIAQAQGQAFALETTRYAQLTRARKDGIDEQTIRNTLGDPLPIKVTPSRVWKPDARKTNYLSLIQATGPPVKSFAAELPRSRFVVMSRQSYSLAATSVRFLSQRATSVVFGLAMRSWPSSNRGSLGPATSRSPTASGAS